ncbi:MAG: AarF/UbiB family protein, partial [Planctomycetota bacterium]|nr:AarF/UbiB family protein [Planctomycetota bacterium]
VPKVYSEYSTKHVLTMDYLEGVHLDEYLADDPSQEQRDRYGERIMRSSFRLAHAAELWYADSNPGNYVFMKDGRLGLLDFGCCRDFSDEEWEFYKEVGRAFLAGDDEAYRRAMCRAADVDPNDPKNADHIDLLVKLGSWFQEYITHDGPFDFGNEKVLQQGIDMLATLTRKRYFRSLPVTTWINRQLLGVRSLLFRLRARVDMKTVCEEESKGVFD